ncbi:DNA mismatch repair protein MutT [Cellvibrio mixtus]|uniref:GDP-mannose pyrophosphatase n=1 Tax=Cellvibrio mixtus TaxID=39650 RepID=A0A266QBF0_9GAMM|nr:NUDIX hydrolase [Cellvibrio mixtus]OZY87175.1 DNA mismatch repair protein MutT [Cellvibrio mixtus]
MSENTSDKSPHNAPWVNEKVGGWKTKSTRIAYENPWISVSHNEVITPTGTDGIYGVVHFKNIAIGVVPIDSDGNTWLVKQSRYSLNQYTWEIPEGGCPQGESPLAAAKRELEEEVGMQARDWQELMTMHLSNSVTDEYCVVFVARDLFAGQQQLEATEDIECKKVPLQTAIDMVKRGEITDAISVAALLRLALE